VAVILANKLCCRNKRRSETTNGICRLYERACARVKLDDKKPVPFPRKYYAESEIYDCRRSVASLSLSLSLSVFLSCRSFYTKSAQEVFGGRMLAKRRDMRSVLHIIPFRVSRVLCGRHEE